MNTEKKKRNTKRTFLANGAVFILGAAILYDDGKIMLASLQMLAGICNWLMVILADEKQKEKLNYIVLVFNIIVALATSIDYFISGKKYIQYAWIIIAVLSFIPLIKVVRKNSR